MIEDFVPFTDRKALLTIGPGFRELRLIVEAEYELGARLEITAPRIMRKGDYLRLGHYDGDTLVYSDGWEGPHQPFNHRGHRYYSDRAPHARLYCDGQVLIDHWPGVVEVCNPWADGEDLFFEARDADAPAPEGWHVYRADLDGRNVRRLFRGANPCVFGDHIYFGVWNGRAFDIARTDRRDCLSADAHLSARHADPDQLPR